MSLRAEALRFALRKFAKGHGNQPPDLALIRRNLDRISRYIIPKPPRGTAVTPVEVDGLSGIRVTTKRTRPDRHLLYLHGGGYAYGMASVYRNFVWQLAYATEATVLCIDYRLAPEHPFPAAVDDAALAYRWLLANGADPRRMTIAGDSAGGGLTFATLLRLRDDAVPLPAAAVALSPWTDLTLGSESFRRNAKADPMLNAAQAQHLADWYLGGADPRHPYASPLYGDPAGLPPTLIQVGSDEILYDDAVGMAERLRQAGGSAEVEIWPRMPHVWQLYASVLPEARTALDHIGRFVRQHMDAG